MEKSDEEKEKVEELFTDELAFAIAAIARRLVIEGEDKITIKQDEKLSESNL